MDIPWARKKKLAEWKDLSHEQIVSD